ncbi:MAG: hypothetical protein KGS61_02295 [Verrucomicrobia bacterium]|nr:hypothetical protein [Verrucomicrobiota bacterium]
MRSETTPAFWRRYRSLPLDVRRLARKNYRLWRENPHHPSLRFKQVKPGIWSARIGLPWRALAVTDGDTFIWFWIGHHREYDRFLKSQDPRKHQ